MQACESRKEYGMEQGSSYDRIYEVVKQIPYGRVATYGQVASLAGNPRWARVVGYALHVNPDPDHISKAFAFGGENRQITLLEAEGVEFDEHGLVDMERFQWRKRIF